MPGRDQRFFVPQLSRNDAVEATRAERVPKGSIINFNAVAGSVAGALNRDGQSVSVHPPTPTAFHSSAWGCEARATPGWPAVRPNSERVASIAAAGASIEFECQETASPIQLLQSWPHGGRDLG